MLEILTILFWGWLAGAWRKDTGTTYRSPSIPQYNSTDWLNLCRMTPRDFEIYCASWLEKYGYRCNLTKVSGDDNVDIFVENNGQMMGIAECKHHKGTVGARTIKVLYATMLQYGVSDGWIFSLKGFSEGAIRYLNTLQGIHIRLVEGKAMISEGCHVL